MHWEPTDTVAILLRLVGSLKDGLYWALIVACPVAGWAVLFPVLIYLKFSKCVSLGVFQYYPVVFLSTVARFPSHHSARIHCRAPAADQQLPRTPCRPCGCRTAKLRKRELLRLHKSTARRFRLGRRETVMADALVRVGVPVLSTLVHHLCAHHRLLAAAVCAKAAAAT